MIITTMINVNINKNNDENENINNKIDNEKILRDEQTDFSP